jgi:four helix bundle protein
MGSSTRAAESVVRNLAEGAGRWSEADSASRYKIARGEAMECAASLDVMRLRELITEAHYARGGQLLEGVVAMLTKMIRASTVASTSAAPSPSMSTTTSPSPARSTSTNVIHSGEFVSGILSAAPGSSGVEPPGVDEHERQRLEVAPDVDVGQPSRQSRAAG